MKECLERSIHLSHVSWFHVGVQGTLRVNKQPAEKHKKSCYKLTLHIDVRDSCQQLEDFQLLQRLLARSFLTNTTGSDPRSVTYVRCKYYGGHKSDSWILSRLLPT